MSGIVTYGAYVPYHRLPREQIGAALGTPGGKGTRAVAGFDEDSTSMAVEAARRALPNGERPRSLHFATTAPAYADKTNATTIHAALALDRECFAVDVVGSVRGGVGALRAAAASGGMAVLSDIRIGRPGSADERDGGDGAAAFLFGDGEEVIAEIVAEASVTSEFLDRWRSPGDVHSRVWEERFGLERYLPLVQDAVGRALQAAEIEAPDHVIVSSPHLRAARSALKGFPAEAAAAHGLQGDIGYLGAADAGVLLADTLDRAAPGQTILLVVASDGCDATVLRVTEAIERRRADEPVREQIARSREVTYADFLTWRGLLEREPPRRPDPERPAAPPAARSERWKFSFHGSRCEGCGTVHLPPQRVCVRCSAIDRMVEAPLADEQATVATYTVDRLAYSLAPPVIDVVVDFDGGGRYQCQMTDLGEDAVGIGDRVEMTFRRLYTAKGVHNYFWKARPARNGAAAAEEGS